MSVDQTMVENNNVLSSGQIIFYCVVAFFLVLFLIIYLRKRKSKLNIEELDIGVGKVSITNNPVEKISFDSPIDFDYHLPVRIHDIKIKVYDKNNSGLPNRSVSISVKDAEKEEVLCGNLTASTNSDGVATFSGLRIVKGGSYIFIAICEGKQCASEPYDIPDFTSKAERIIFVTQPDSTPGRPAYLNKISVRVSNSENDGLFGRKVHVSIYDKKREKELLSGTLDALTDQDGFASFPNLSISKTGKHQIVAFCDDKNCTSAEFEINPPGIDTNFKNQPFGSQEYYDALYQSLYMNNAGDLIKKDGEEIL